MTLKQLAQELGVSVTTVSDALKDNPSGYVAPQTRDRIRKAAARLGYSPNVHARRLVTQRAANVVGIYSRTIPSFDLQFTKLQTIQAMLAERGFEQIVAFGGDETFARIARQNPAGLIVFNWTGLGDTLEPFLHAETRIVVLDNAVPALASSSADRVVFDRTENTRIATRHLLEIGHRRIGVFLPADHWPEGERGRGVFRALAAFGLGIGDVTAYAPGRIAEFETGTQVAEEWLAQTDRPTGLVLLNDETAAGFLTRVHAAGVRVPEDVSVVGHDDRAWSPHLRVPLTTVTHPGAAIAGAAVDLLLRRIDGRDDPDAPPDEVIIGSELILRASTAPPSKGAPAILRHETPNEGE